MFNYSYLVELRSPKRSNDDQFDSFLDRFAERYRRIIDAGVGVSHTKVDARFRQIDHVV
jgi:hypothetical protein